MKKAYRDNLLFIENFKFGPSLFKSPHYLLDPGGFSDKLNRIVRAESRTRKRENIDYGKMLPPPEFKTDIIKYENAHCSPPILAIRKWKIWLKSMHNYIFPNKKPCKKCLFSKKQTIFKF